MRKILIRLFVILMGCTVVLGVLEIGARLFWEKIRGPIFPVSVDIHRVSADKKLEYELIPNSSTYLDDVWYRINQDGLRDTVYPREKPANTFRIAAVGDSMTFGLALEMPDTWPKQLEQKLRRSQANVEVLNFGVMGYDTTQEAEQIQSKILPYTPDLIIIGYSLNDIGLLSRERRELKQYHGYEKFFTTGIGFFDRALKHSKLHMFLKNRIFLLRTGAYQKRSPYSKDGMKVLKVGYNNFITIGYYEKENLDRLKAGFAQIRAATFSRCPVLVAIFPELIDFENYIYRDVHQIVMNLARENDFLGLDTLDVFLRHNADSIRISRVNRHPNRLGCDIFATAISEDLQARHLLH